MSTSNHSKRQEDFADALEEVIVDTSTDISNTVEDPVISEGVLGDQILSDILCELKIMNTYFALMTNTHIKEEVE